MATTNIQSFAGQVEVNSNLTVNTNTLHVDSVAGRVGIGKTDPAYAMDVNGTVNATALYVDGSEFSGSPWTSNVSNIYYTGGNVGIGTATDPQKTLEVAGPMRITDGGTNVSDLSVKGGDSWELNEKATMPSPARQNTYLGRSVSISNDGSYAIIGGPGVNAATVWTRSGTSWSAYAISSPSPAQGDKFGGSVAISGDGSYAIIGAYRKTVSQVGNGYVYFYHRSGTSWVYQTAIADPPTRNSYDFYGQYMAMSDDGSYALISKPRDDTNYTDAGSVYFYYRSGNSWYQQQKITAPDNANYKYFGGNVGMSGDASTAVVSPFGNGVYVYTRTTGNWSYQTKLVLPPGPSRGFISKDGSTILVTDYQNTTGYVFTRSGSNWTMQSSTITASDAGPSDQFGWSSAISGDGTRALISAHYQTLTYTNEGAVYFYDFEYGRLKVSTPIVADGTLLSFTGQHICFPEGPMGQGLVVSANKNKYVSLNGSLTTGTRAIKSSEALPVVSLSNVANDRSVFGVVDHFEQSGTTRSQTSGATVIKQDKESGDNRVVVNSLGEGAIWVANTNGNVVSGDFLTTSHLPGYAQRQSDNDTLLNYTVAKSTMDCDFEPEDLPVQVILKDDDGNNVLDSHGRLQWVDSDRTEPEYRIRYLDVSGTPTDEANAVHKAAYVGCTYHCG